MRETNYYFDPRLAHARTPPAEWYFDSSMLEREKSTVFARTWQLAGRAEDVADPGQFFTATVADEPVIVARGADSQLRALSNVCRHRAGPVAAGRGRCEALRCGYHGWSYALDGQLTATPEWGGVEGFDRAAHSLPQFRVETWGALVFVNLDAGCAPLAETLEDLPARLARRDLSSMKFALRKEWVVECNWKVYVDNYLEGYHIPVVHPALNRELDYARYRTETKRLYSIQHSPIRADRATRLKIDAEAEENEAQYFWLFPNLMLNVYPDNYSTNLIMPLSAERTLTVFEWYFDEPGSEKSREALNRTVEFSDEIQLEDIRVCEAVQRGLRSRTYAQGRYSVKRENGVHHFLGLLAEFFARG
jgi:choline monooxygenase